MINCAICDDEEIFSNRLKNMISDICSKNEIEYKITIFNSANGILNSCRNYHVIFMDIDMPDIDGIEAVEEINDKKEKNEFPLIVFVSNMENLVFKALEQYPYIFLRKMFLKDELEKCILRINAEIVDEHRIVYSIKDGRNKIIINLNDVMYLEKEKNYVKFVLKNNIYRERSKIDEKYDDIHTKGFIRVHIGYLVNARFILEFQTNNVILTTEQRIPLSKKYRNTATNEFFEWLEKNND